jgi:hypothetical protein
MAFVTTTTMTAGVQLIQRFWLLTDSTVPGESFKGYLNVFLILSMMAMVAIILFESVRKWLGPPSGRPMPAEKPVAA